MTEQQPRPLTEEEKNELAADALIAIGMLKAFDPSTDIWKREKKRFEYILKVIADDDRLPPADTIQT